ncbi:MAG TPA: hypothetical protein VKB88_20755 [Bryobacteraceae bacterium]|nr:hypothetical protein [Bryobacteraceae bacterium]
MGGRRKKGTRLSQPLAVYQQCHIDVPYLNIGALYYLCSIDGLNPLVASPSR